MQRSDNLDRLPDSVDILVIGGGATGLGVALDAITRGYSTVLVEARDFAQGTSSTSTNLVHGGVRYLKQGNVRLVRSALRERGILARNAPHLVDEMRLIIPAYKRWEKPYYGCGLRLYDVIAGPRRFSRSRVVDVETATDLVPGLCSERLQGGVLFSDGRFNDARLALCLAKTARTHGAVLVNHAPVTSLLKQGHRIKGAEFVDLQNDREYKIHARTVINATGVYTDTVRRMDEPAVADLLVASQGTHLVLPARFLGGSAGILVPRTRDGRVCFLIPWEGCTLLGTTDTPVPSATVAPKPTEEEIDFLLKSAAEYLADKPSRSDILSAFAGLRPLVKGSTAKTSALSRDHTLEVSAGGLLTVAGGKWTTYRHMAAAAVDMAAAVGGLPSRPCVTESLMLDGAEAAGGRWAQFGVPDSVASEYERRFPGMLHPELPYSMGMVGYVVEEEMPVTIDDVLSRRLRALRLNPKVALEAAPVVAELMAGIQKRDGEWIANQVGHFARLAHGAMVAGEHGTESDGETAPSFT